mgnify:CR=1 FL=1|jgi:hypothetical protein|uniref:Uncharacterized protein n=1 Tax=viral metagenome TaxID=1070528 RepID=A0A6C0IJH0_9ZZZZ
MEDLIQLTEPQGNNNLLISEFDISGGEYYRDYSFIDRPFSLELNKIEQEKRKQDILNYTSRTPIITKNQQYANKARGISQHRKKTFATQSLNKKTNPNSNNLIRVDKNKMIINESPYTEVPYIKTSIPYNHDIRNNVYTDGNMISTRQSNSVMKYIKMPRVENRPLPAEDSILEGGILYAGTKFIPDVTERDDYSPSLYKLSEKAIVESHFAEYFQMNVEKTYTEEELLEITGKTMTELYPFLPSWERDYVKNGVRWNPENGGNMGAILYRNPYDDTTLGEFIPSMYNRDSNYQYNKFDNTYIPMVTSIIFIRPKTIKEGWSELQPITLKKYNAIIDKDINN